MPVITTQQSTTTQVPPLMDMTTLSNDSEDVLSTLESDHVDSETDQTATVEWTTWIAVTTTNLSRELENTIWTTETTQETTTGSIFKDLQTLPSNTSDETTSMSTTTDALETTSTTPLLDTITTDTPINLKTTVSSSSIGKPSTAVPFPTESRKPENWGTNGQEREMNNITTPVRPISFPHDSTKLTTRAAISYSTPFDYLIPTTTSSASVTLFTIRSEKRTEDVTAGVTAIHQPTNGRPPEADLVSITLEPETDTATANASIDLEIPLSIHPHPEESNTTTDTPSLPTDPSVAITTLPTDLDIKNQTTTVKAMAGEYPLMDPTYPALSPGIPAGSCTSEICMNGGTCVMTQEGWQVLHAHSANKSNEFFNLIFFSVAVHGGTKGVVAKRTGN
jgi:hypothetical protein